MLVTITVALAAVAVLAAIVVVAVGGGGELSTEHPDHPPLSLPARPAGGTDAALLRLPVGLWGYHKQITDQALERFSYELTERDTRIAVLEQELAETRMRAGENGRQEEHWRPALPAPSSPQSGHAYQPGARIPGDAHATGDPYDAPAAYGADEHYDDQEAYDHHEAYGERESHDEGGAHDEGGPYESPALPAPRDADASHVAESDDDGHDRPEPPRTITDEMVYELKTIAGEKHAGGRPGDDDAGTAR